MIKLSIISYLSGHYKLSLLILLWTTHKYIILKTTKSSSVALEVILHPPSPGHASFDGGIGVKLPQVDDSNTTIRLSYLPDSAKASLFVSHSQTQALDVLLKSQNDTIGNSSIRQRNDYRHVAFTISDNILYWSKTFHCLFFYFLVVCNRYCRGISVDWGKKLKMWCAGSFLPAR